MSEPTPSPAASPDTRAPTALGVCVLLITGFAAVAWCAARTKCATFDEPYHAMAAWVQHVRGNYSMDPEDGPLFHALAASATGPAALSADFSDPQFEGVPNDRGLQWPWLLRTLYRTPGNDADAFLLRQRTAMLAVGVALAVLLCAWAWKLGGAAAGVVATTLFCLDPNFLAHAPLVKNDVAFTLVMAAMAGAVWAAGRRLSGPGAMLVAVLAPIGLAIKFSALLLLPILAGLLLVRALLPWRWQGAGRAGGTIVGRIAVALGLALLTAGLSWAGVWAAYGFRFGPSRDASVSLNVDQVIALTRQAELVRQTRHPERSPTPADWAAYRPSATLQAAQWVLQRRLLPQAFIDGFVYTYQSTLLRDGYLLGRVSIYGRWQYYPLAFLFKTPLATLVAAGAVAIVAVGLVLGGATRFTAADLWSAACLLLPAGIYLAWAMTSAVNIGIRHLLPVYPFLYLMMAVVAAAAWRRWALASRFGGGIALALALALAVESLSAYPDFLPFFNVAAGGERGGLQLLGDSNLDWGQDLPLLANWQKQHATVPLYLAYFGQADPAYYGIHYINLPGGYKNGPPPAWPSAPGYIAISATFLQSLWLPPDLYRTFYAQFWQFEPLDVLGGSIYIYAFPPHR